MGYLIVYPFLSDEYKKRIDDEIHQYIQYSYAIAKQVLVENLELFNAFVERLYDQTTLVEKDISEVTNRFHRKK